VTADPTPGMTQDAFRALALSLPDAAEEPHVDRPSFRVRGKIFATLPPGGVQAVVKLPREHQELVTAEQPDIFTLGPWSSQGWTYVALARLDGATARSVLLAAWRSVAPKRLSATLPGWPG